MSIKNVAQLVASTEDVTIIREHQRTSKLDLTDRDIRMIRTEVNNNKNRLSPEFTADGQVELKATSYVGLVALPDGPVIEIQPKIPTANLLYLLQFSTGVSPETYDDTVPVKEGTNFVNALAALFETELRRLFRQGLRKEYKNVSQEKSHLRGKLHVQKQIQQNQGTAAVSFHCSYNTLTHDTVLNQAILYATKLLSGMVSDHGLASRLDAHVQRLRKSVSLRPVSHTELERIEISRLHAHYQDILRLVEMVLMNSYIENYTAGRNSSFALLVNMNTVFEKVVERGFINAGTTFPEVNILTKQQTGCLFRSSAYSVDIEPDVTLKKNNSVICVADAKWKTGDPVNDDFYQLAAYQQAHTCHGVLVYPHQSSLMEFHASLTDGMKTSVIEVSVGSDVNDYAAFVDELTSRILTYIRKVVEKA